MVEKKLSREENRQRRVNDILDVAETAFVEKGFRGAGIGTIAKNTGISVGHLYHYFPNKNEIILEIIRRDMEKQRANFEEMEAVPPEQFAGVMSGVVNRVATESMELFQTGLNFEILAEAQRNPEVAELVQSYDKEFRTRFAAILREKLGLKDAIARTEMVFTLISGVAARFARYPERDKEEQAGLVSQMVEEIVTGRVLCAKTGP